MSLLDIIGGGTLTPIMNFGEKIIDKIWPDKTAQAVERDKAKLALLEMQQSGEFQKLQVSMSAILAEANSEDPWTSRARPTFMYVIYIMILASLPMGLLSAFKPEIATSVAHGMQAWLTAIPDGLYALFGVGYLGYAGAKSVDNSTKAKKQVAMAANASRNM